MLMTISEQWEILEPPVGEVDAGVWTQVVYTAEQQKRLEIDLHGMRNGKPAVPIFHIQTINLDGCVSMTDHTIRRLVRYIPHLTRCFLSSCILLTDQAILDLAACNLQELSLRMCQRLTDLCLMNNPRLMAISLGRRLSPSTVGLGHCSGLKYLNLSHCPLFTAVGMAEIARGCANLEQLNISECRSLNATSPILLPILANHCLQLNSVDFSGLNEMTDRPFTHFMRSCTQLTELDLSGCVRLTDTAVCSLSGTLDNVMCPLMEEPDVHAASSMLERLIAQRKWTYRLESHEEVLANPQIREAMETLDTAVNRHKRYREAVLGSLLQCIRLSRCTMLSDESIFGLTRLTDLRSLHLTGIRQLTSKCVPTLVALGPQLQTVDVSGFPWVDDMTVRTMAEACPNLTRLNLSGCFLVSSASIDVLEEKCSQLKFSEQPGNVPPSVWGSTLSLEQFKKITL